MSKKTPLEEKNKMEPTSGDAVVEERELTAEELAERDVLRKEYIAEWRQGAMGVLDNLVIQTPDGKKHKLQKKQ